MTLTEDNFSNYAQTRKFSDQTLQAVIKIIENQTNDCCKIAPPSDDRKLGVDLYTLFSGKSISVRVRSKQYVRYYGEITIRNQVVRGGTTEVFKWHCGIMADWCFYGFEDHNHIIKWVLLDQKKLWEMMGKTFEDCQLKVNPDGTEFYAIPWKYFKDCIIDYSH